VRIAIVGATQGVVGGAETYLAWLLRALVGQGHEVAFAYERSATGDLRPVDREVTPLLRLHIGALSRADFFERLRAFRPEIVFLQACEDEALDLELATRFQTVLFAHAFYASCAAGWRVHHFPKLEVCARRFGPACIPINYLRGCGARNPLPLVSFYGKQRVRAEVLQRIAGLVVASGFMRELYLRHDVPEQRVRVIAPPAEIEPDAAPPKPSSTRSRVLFLGRLTTGKGASKGIEATAKCQRALGRPLHLTIAGDGPELVSCKALAQTLGVETDFVGWVDAERRAELLRRSDVLIVPSLWPEPFGMVGIEAASVGLPAVGFAVGGIVDWIRPGRSGELAIGADFAADSLAHALERALRDAEHHRKLQHGAWELAHEFSGARHLARLQEFFAELLALPAASTR